MNRFARRIDVGFEASTHAIEAMRAGYGDLDRSSIFKVDINDIDPRIQPFLTGLGLSVFHTEVFYTSPGRFTQIHVDGPGPNDRCKLNWAYGAPGCQMKWYRDRPGSTGPLLKKTAIGTSYMAYDADQCEQVFSAEIGLPSLVQAGTPHNIHNDTDEGRWCLSVVPGHTGNRSGFVTWEQGERIFSPFFAD